MKRKTLLAIVLLALAGAFAVPQIRSEEPVKEKKISKKDLAKYDADHDGVLNTEEEAVRAADKAKAKAERKARKSAEAPATPAAPATDTPSQP